MASWLLNLFVVGPQKSPTRGGGRLGWPNRWALYASFCLKNAMVRSHDNLAAASS